MKPFRFLPAAPVFCAALLVAACEKGGSTGPDSSSDKAALLVGKEWVLTASISEPGYQNEEGEIVTDLLAGGSGDCVEIHPIHLEAGGRFPVSPAQGKCDEEAPPLPAGAWSLKNGGAILVIDYDGEAPPLEFEILSLTEKTLKLSFELPAMGDFPARKIIQTFTAK